MRRRLQKSPLIAAIAAALSPPTALAVSLNPDGLGQALIYPYYTVRSSEGGNAFNTYFSVVNTTPQAKAVRVRAREGRAGKPVLDFNLYLGPNDVWTAAMVPTSTAAQLVSADTSCTDPVFVPGSGSASAPLRDVAFIGPNADGFGDTLDRTREGFVEIIEMATLTGASAQAASHTSSGMPANCAAVRFPNTVSTAAPTGGLSGTLTLINVNSGLDFTLDATALENLTTRAFFHPPGESEPNFASAEIDPVSVLLANGSMYRSVWARPQDAVSAALMGIAWLGEYVLDNPTASLTDIVATQPTRHLYLNGNAFSSPYSAPGSWNPPCLNPDTSAPPAQRSFGESLSLQFFNREEQGALLMGSDFPELPPSGPSPHFCASAAVGSVRNAANHMPANRAASTVLGSISGGLSGIDRFTANIDINPGFQNGWIAITHTPRVDSPLASLPASTRTDLVTGAVSSGSHVHRGLPVVGFTVRRFTNGTLSCAGAPACQGNYGGAFALRRVRSVGPANP